MNKLMHQLARLAREEEGTEIVEWTLVGGIIVVLTVGIFGLIGDDVRAVFDAIHTQTSDAAGTAGGTTTP